MESKDVVAIMAAVIYSAGMERDPIAYPDAVEAAALIYSEAQRLPDMRLRAEVSDARL
jgi:hypothetical protein